MDQAVSSTKPARSFTIAEWCAMRRVGRTRAFEEITTGRLKTYRVGRRRYISDEADAQWLRERESESLNS